MVGGWCKEGVGRLWLGESGGGAGRFWGMG